MGNGREKESVETHSSLIHVPVMFFNFVEHKNALGSLRENLVEEQKNSL